MISRLAAVNPFTSALQQSTQMSAHLVFRTVQKQPLNFWKFLAYFGNQGLIRYFLKEVA